ncbi:MAG: hypothetical protein H0T76_05985 [Nannocystis sp.]|nr:hypothetical protein [Nannocystis sp.]MBA3546010.1 hypothetical protein [Nannocystis sp.]
MTIKVRDLRSAVTTTPPLETLLGGRPARKHRVLEQHRQADNLLGNWRNVVARVGLHGAESFQVPSVSPDSPGQVYPLRSVSRVVARVPPFAMHPGHVLKVSALVAPAGLTQKLDGDWQADGAGGRIDVIANFTGPGVSTKTEKQQVVASTEKYAGEDTAAGASWATLRRIEFPLIFPDDFTTSTADLRLWSEGCVAELAILYRGGLRVVDLVVQQVPLGYARDVGVDTLYSSPLATDGQGAAVKSYPVAYPISERSATDPTFGTEHLADITHRQQTALGHVLMHWTAFREDSAPVDAVEIPSVTVTSTSFVDVLHQSVTAWAPTNPGWSLSSGSMCQQFKTGNGRREMRGKNGVVPVRVWVYGSRSVSGTSTLRFQSSAHSVVEVTITSATPGWWSATGYLRCGAHPEDPSVLQVFGRASAGSTLSVSSFLVEYIDL